MRALFLLIYMTGFFVDSASGAFNEKQGRNKPDGGNPVVAITQIVPHPSLDQIRQGILDALDDAGMSAKIHYANAQGNFATAMQIAQQFKGMKADLVIAISTPSAQTLKQSRIESPILFAGITDPEKAQLEPSDVFPNISGTSTKPPIKKQLYLIKKLFPESKNIGVLLNDGESNSRSILESLEEAVKALGLSVIYQSVKDTASVSQALDSIIPKIDLLFILQDNTVAASLPLILRNCKKHLIPTFASYPEAIKQGALFGLACDDYSVGKQTGSMALKILQGMPVEQMPIQPVNTFSTYINTSTATLLKISFPQEMLENATHF